MDIDRFYQMMGTAVKRVYGFYIKRPLQRFNVDNRAEKLMEKQKTIPKTAPRHEGTDQLFKEMTNKYPKLREELNVKHEELLKRLDSIKVVSKEREFSEEDLKEMEEIRQRVRNRLPQSRYGINYPIHAFTEPAFVPKGRASLLSSMDFIAKHFNDPKTYDSETIAKQYHLKVEDVDNVLTHFRHFLMESNPDKEENEEPRFRLSKIIDMLKPNPKVINEQIESSSDQTSNDKKEENVENKKNN